MDIYFVYIPFTVKDLGLIHPNAGNLDYDVKLGLYFYKQFIFGQCKRMESLIPLRNYIIDVFTDEEIFKGLPFVGYDYKIESKKNPFTNQIIDLSTRTLTEEEYKWKQKAEKYVQELETKYKLYIIKTDVLYNLIKKINILEKYIEPNKKDKEELEKINKHLEIGLYE